MKKCIICNSPNITKSFNKNQFVYFKCTDCQVLFVDLEMAAEDVFANYSEDYYEADAIGVED